MDKPMTPAGAVVRAWLAVQRAQGHPEPDPADAFNIAPEETAAFARLVVHLAQGREDRLREAFIEAAAILRASDAAVYG